MQNPFDQIDVKLSRIENILLELKTSSSKPIEKSKYLTIKEVADILDLSVQTIYGLVHRKKIPFIKKQKRLYFKESDIITWLEEGNSAVDKGIRK